VNETTSSTGMTTWANKALGALVSY